MKNEWEINKFDLKIERPENWLRKREDTFYSKNNSESQ